MLIAFIMLSNDLSSLFFKKEYHDISVKLIPLFAVTSFLIAIRVNYFDLVFQITGHTYWIFFITLISIFLNILLFIYFLPLFGLEGLSYALLLSSLFALLASIIIGRSFFKLPFFSKDFVKICIASLAVGIFFSIPFRAAFWPILLLKIFLGVLIYISFLTFLKFKIFRVNNFFVFPK
jgi:O-antigen/teichoic acid export membrane protein